MADAPAAGATHEEQRAAGPHPAGEVARDLEAEQVNPTNALVAVMLAVSLLCQEADSNWMALRALVWKDKDAWTPHDRRR